VDFAGQWCRSQRCRTMAANAEVANPGAQTFLARAGFEETYRIVEYRKSLD
jgi:GNAT superfamily N-acetyltransferase